MDHRSDKQGPRTGLGKHARCRVFTQGVGQDRPRQTQGASTHDIVGTTRAHERSRFTQDVLGGDYQMELLSEPAILESLQEHDGTAPKQKMKVLLPVCFLASHSFGYPIKTLTD